MKISTDLDKYCIDKSITIFRAMEALTERKLNTVFVVSKKRLIGSITDGDIRRFILEHGASAIDQPITKAMNPKVIFLDEGVRPTQESFLAGVKVIPVCSEDGLIQKFFTREAPSIEIAGRLIGEGLKPFVIAEIGINHQGSLELAKELIRIAKDAGADCAKFQMRDMENLYSKSGSQDPSGDLGTQYTLNILDKFSLTDAEMFAAFDYCEELGILPMCTPWDATSLRKLEAWGMCAYKVASADFTNMPLLEELAKTRKPLFLSTGMSTQHEIGKTVEFLQDNVDEFCLLHCNSTYPAPYKDVNLSYLETLKNMTSGAGIVGYSGHERGWFIPCAAVALGACVIEKHITTDRTLEGNDHKVSLLPGELTELVKAVFNTHVSMGTNDARKLSQGEMINRQTLSKSVVAAVNLQKDDLIKESDLDVMSPGNGLQPNRKSELIGIRACRNIMKGEPFFASDIEGKAVEAREFSFSRPFGIPVRYHDYRDLVQYANLDFVEFHMSSRDLKLSPSDFLKIEGFDFAVHAPDLFENDHIIDLGSADPAHREQSIINLQEVVDVTRALKHHFPKTNDPVVVLNVGGWSKHRFMTAEEAKKCENLIAEGLEELDSKGVTLAIQTMPPFPWHFGGQGYCNFFTNPDAIVRFCEAYNVKVCLDVSHCLMSSSYFGFKLDECISKVAPYVVHIHISDADGVDGEGVVFGQGDLDLDNVLPTLQEYCPSIQFLPEIWQGHNNSGMGFWDALMRLNRLL